MATAAATDLALSSLPLLSCRTPPCLSVLNKSNPPLPVKYTRNPVEANEFIDETSLHHSGALDKIYGLDIEWKVTYGGKQRPTALLQLCDGKTVYLFHLCHMYSFPSALRELLEDPTIQMSGVGIRGDAQRLQKDYGVLCAGLVDLGPISSNYLVALPPTALGSATQLSVERIVAGKPSLQALVEVFLQRHLTKGPVRISNWESLPLSLAQVEYAATDALASYLVYQKFRLLANLLPIDPGPIVIIDFGAEVAQGNRVAGLRKRGWSGPDDDDFFEDLLELTDGNNKHATCVTVEQQKEIQVEATDETEQSILQFLEQIDPTIFDTSFDSFELEDDPYLDTTFDIDP